MLKRVKKKLRGKGGKDVEKRGRIKLKGLKEEKEKKKSAPPKIARLALFLLSSLFF